MTWIADTLAAFKAWYGQGADDATATRALSIALATVETWLDRPLEQAERSQEDFGADTVLLRAWPVEQLVSIAVPIGTAPELDQVKLDKRTGRLALAGCCYDQVTTTYVGGFATMPADLEFALWQIAAAVYPAAASAAGASSGAQVARVSTPDVGTVEFRSSGAAGETADAIAGGTLSPAIEALLQRYRAESVVGAG